jgi:hypothetical protein
MAARVWKSSGKRVKGEVVSKRCFCTFQVTKVTKGVLWCKEPCLDKYGLATEKELL